MHVLRRPDADPTERFEAAKLLLEYGVPDVVLEALAGMDVGTAWVRRLRQSAAQLDRLGLGQSAHNLGRGDDAEREQLNALRGAVERLVNAGRRPWSWCFVDASIAPGCRSILCIVSCGPLAPALCTCATSSARDIWAAWSVSARISVPLSRRYLSCERGRAHGEWLVIGHCVGCAGALRYGLALGVEAVLGVLPRVGAPYLGR